MDTKDKILSGLAKRAAHYVPEWRFNPSSPDAGAAMALIWADMIAGTLERVSRLPDNYHRDLLDQMGYEPKQAVPAQGFLVFQPHSDTEEPVLVPAGTYVACPSVPGAVLETNRDLIVSPASLTAMCYVSPSHDCIRVYNGTENQVLFQPAPPAAHIWTLSHPYAFDVASRARLRLEMILSDGNASWLCREAIWEYEDGAQWNVLYARPDGNTLMLLFPEGKESPCRRIRFCLRGGVSGMEVRAIRAFPSGSALFADAVYAGETQLTEPRFYPFEQRFIPGLCFYIACNDALNKPGAVIELSFDLCYEDFPIEGYSTPPVYMKKVMKALAFEPPEAYEITVSEVAYEYYNGTGWASLKTGEPELFDGGAERQCTLRFICPPDIKPALCGAHEALFIRVRILKASNLFRMHGHYRTPVISELRFRYEYPDGVPVTDAEIREHRDTRVDVIDHPVPLVGALPKPGAMYLSFDKPFVQGTFLLVVESNRPFPLRWEYACASGFTPLDVRDGTGGLSRPGILNWQTSTPCVKMRLFGREAYWMRLCDAEERYELNGRTGPRLLMFYPNVVSATARTPGSAANLPPGSFCSLSAPVPGIAGVFNPLPTYGGAEEETENGTIRRLTARFCHNDRAVSAADCEALALEASLRVCRARCYPGVDETGSFAHDCACLVILCMDATGGSFEALSNEILAYLEARRPLGASRLCVTRPHMMTIQVRLDAFIAEPDAALVVKTDIQETLERYLDPVYGGPNGGWCIGALPKPGDLNALLRTIPGVLWISRLEVLYCRGNVSLDYNRAANEPFVLPRNGTHSINLMS